MYCILFDYFAKNRFGRDYDCKRFCEFRYETWLGLNSTIHSLYMKESEGLARLHCFNIILLLAKRTRDC